MKKFKKHEGETVKALKEFNAHLRNEVRELKDKHNASEKCKIWAYNELLNANNRLRMAESRADRYEFSNRLLKKEIEQLKGGSIFTVSKRETELERKLESERMRADELSERNAELSEQLDTVSKRYEETQNAVTELMDENTMLKAKLEKAEEENKRLKNTTRVPISREQAAEIFFGKEQKDGENDDD